MTFLKTSLIAAGLLLAALASQAQRVAVVRFPELQRRLAQAGDTTLVVNFWATWCGPCVKEIPDFEQVRATSSPEKVRFLLVSLDYVSQLDKKVRPFVQKHALKSEVLLLNETDPNTWLTKIDPQWSGAIPFTLVLNAHTQQRATFERSLSPAELRAVLQKFLK